MSDSKRDVDDEPEDELSPADRESFMEEMREWFFEHYEDPAENCPYDSSEGGYFYNWGGPYHAEDVLREQFEESVPVAVIMELVDELSGLASDWSGKPGDDDYDSYLADLALATSEQLATCEARLNGAEQLAKQNLSPDLKQMLLQMVFVQVIAILETFLSDTFIRTVVPNDSFLRKFVETCREFQKQKFPLSRVFSEREEIAERAKIHLTKIMWHNLAKAGKMYKTVLGVPFAPSAELYKAIRTRHDCVHRDGRTTGGQPVIITEQMIQDLIDEIRSLVRGIDANIPKPI